MTCLVTGSAVEVKGNVDAQGLVQPVMVERQGPCATAWPVSGLISSDSSSGSSPALSAGLAESSGRITAVRAGEFDLQLFKLNDAGSALSMLTVCHGSATLYKKLRADTLAVGQYVDVKGLLTGGILQASKLALED